MGLLEAEKGWVDRFSLVQRSTYTCFEKDFFKLMNNSVFIKMMENFKKHRTSSL